MKTWVRQDNESSEDVIPIPKAYNSDGVKTNRWNVFPIIDVAVPIKAKFGDFKIGMRGSFDLMNLESYENDSSPVFTENVYNCGMMLYGDYTINKGYFGKKTTSSDVM